MIIYDTLKPGYLYKETVEEDKREFIWLCNKDSNEYEVKQIQLMRSTNEGSETIIEIRKTDKMTVDSTLFIELGLIEDYPEYLL